MPSWSRKSERRTLVPSTAPRPGDYFVTATPGCIGFLIRFATRSKFNHAGIYLGHGIIMEAAPKRGVRYNRLSAYPKAEWSHRFLTPAERVALVRKAISMKGVKYNMLDIFGQALVCFGFRDPLIRERLTSPNHEICSQFVVDCYISIGVLLCPGKQSFEVTPGDLADAIESKPVPADW